MHVSLRAIQLILIYEIGCLESIFFLNYLGLSLLVSSQIASLHQVVSSMGQIFQIISLSSFFKLLEHIDFFESVIDFMYDYTFLCYYQMMCNYNPTPESAVATLACKSNIHDTTKEHGQKLAGIVPAKISNKG